MTSERDLMREEFEAWAKRKGYDMAHTYDTERSRWLWLSPMTADLWDAWQAARRAQHSTAEPVAEIENDYNADGMSSRITTRLPAGTKLFAAPQQAPLTDEQINNIASAFPRTDSGAFPAKYIRDMLRAVEEAHGISAAKETR